MILKGRNGGLRGGERGLGVRKGGSLGRGEIWIGIRLGIRIGGCGWLFPDSED